MISHILACFEVCKPVDDAGNEVEPVIKYDDNSIVRCVLFGCMKEYILTSSGQAGTPTHMYDQSAAAGQDREFVGVGNEIVFSGRSCNPLFDLPHPVLIDAI